MKGNEIKIIFLMSIVYLAGCSTTHISKTSDSYWAKKGDIERKGTGVALAGGGTKAASFSMGVLSALVKEDELWNVDAVSTVSGGSYSGLFLFSRLIEDQGRGELSPDKAKTYFQDCIPMSYAKDDSGKSPFEDNLLKNLDARVCKKTNSEASMFSMEADYLDQQYLRCSQDIIEKSCTFTTTTGDNSSIPNIISLLVGTGMSLPFSLTANTVFDWPINLSPSLNAYKEGMGVAYAMHPINPEVLTRNNKSKFCKSSYSNCSLLDGATETTPSAVMLDPEKRQKFSDLEKLYEIENPPPVWMINATSAPSRSLFGWLNRNQTDVNRFTFSMTPFKQGSVEYGDIYLEENNIDLLSAATASAAFFDANQTVLGQPWKFIVGAGQHFLNLSWGIDVPHPSASETRRKVRSVLPFPLYYLDYLTFKQPAYVRLIDGGSSDNLGAYRLIIDGFRDILISDHAQDVDGRMTDICVLRNELVLRHKLYLHVPGLQDWPRPCASLEKRSMDDQREVDNLFPDLSDSEKESEYFYPIHAWPYPFLAGCVSKSENLQSCIEDEVVQKIWLIKPAMDFSYFHNNQVNRDSGLVEKCEDQKSFYLPCETSGFLINNFGHKYENKYGFPRFPQNGTVAMTIDSSSTLYGAYRDLAEFYTSISLKALNKAKNDKDYFNEILKTQIKYPIRHSLNKKTFNRNRENGDVMDGNWSVRIRNEARKIIGDLIYE